MPSIRLGALCWNQYTDWQSLLEAGRRAERVGFDTLWRWDHLYPIVGSWEGPILEGYTVLTGWAMATEQIRLGLMVGANTFREPTLTAKIATTRDHVSGGRAILGIGAAWFDREHVAYGLRYGEGPPERLRWLAEALPVIRGVLRGETPSAPRPRHPGREGGGPGGGCAGASRVGVPAGAARPARGATTRRRSRSGYRSSSAAAARR